jgi:flagellar protein FliO/FliZ
VGRPRLLPGLASACAFVFALVLAPAALAADETPLPESVRNAQPAPAHAAAGGSGAFVRMIVGLAVVLAVIYGIYWLLKTYGKSKKKVQGDGRIEVVATTALTPERSVHLVKVGDELVLIGSAEHSITPLRVYDEDEARRLTPMLEAEGQLRPFKSSSGGRGPSPFLRIVEDLRRRTAR